MLARHTFIPRSLLVLLALPFLDSGRAQESCPDGYSSSGGDDHCYHVGEQSNWSGARAYCKVPKFFLPPSVRREVKGLSELLLLLMSFLLVLEKAGNRICSICSTFLVTQHILLFGQTGFYFS